MTEEIIIDGVNVAGCPYLYDKTDCSSHDCECIKCVHNSCFYKDMQRLKQENEKLKKQHYEALKMLKHEYDGRRRDNEQWFTRCTENHNEDSKIIEKYRSALEEIRDYCEKCKKCVEAGDEVILYTVIKKVNEVLNES